MVFVPRFKQDSTKINKQFVLSRDCSAMKGTILKVCDEVQKSSDEIPKTNLPNT